MTDFVETGSLDCAGCRIGQLLDRFKAKRMSGCCTARAPLFNGACLLEETKGGAEAAEMLELIAASLRKNDVPAPDRDATNPSWSTWFLI
jgi:hypothetical protein